jgi:tetratricopeptide (TPR) repeat protein
LALANLGNYTGAIECYDNALAIYHIYRYPPNAVFNTNALNNKAEALSNLRNYTGAIECYDKALAIDPNNTYALNNKAKALSNLGKYPGKYEANKRIKWYTSDGKPVYE